MAYIRTNEDYERATNQPVTYDGNKLIRSSSTKEPDPGYCNPRKAKDYAEWERAQSGRR